MIYKSYSKINLYLDILSVRSDGYHELDMVMVPLMFHDELHIEINNLGADKITCPGFNKQTIKHNTVYKALEILRRTYGFKETFTIDIIKNIPNQAGLGGGSSNAATLINAVVSILKIDASEEELIAVAKKVGADVPFFLKVEPARVRGIGEQLEHIKIITNPYVLLVKPEIGLSTAKMYKLSDTLEPVHGEIHKLLNALKEGGTKQVGLNLFNALEQPAFITAPIVKKLKEKMKQLGFDGVLMTGSGSTVFGITEDESIVNKAHEIFKKEGIWSKKTKFKL